MVNTYLLLYSSNLRFIRENGSQEAPIGDNPGNRRASRKYLVNETWVIDDAVRRENASRQPCTAQGGYGD
jgi:hypothetical protein